MAKKAYVAKFKFVFDGEYEFPAGWTKADIHATLLEFLEDDLVELVTNRKALKKAVTFEIDEIKANA